MKIALIPFLLLFLFPFLSVAQLSGTYKIGTPVASACGGACDYESITLAGGAFEALNANGINGNVIFEIYTNLPSETGANVLGSITDTGGPHIITFRPNTTTSRVISGTNNAGGLIVLAGADRVIFDGRALSDQTLSYANRFLTIRNSGSATTVAISSDAVSCSFRSLIIEGRNTATTGVFNVSGGSIAGNDDLNIDYCDIKSDGANLPLIGIAMEGGSTQNNDNVQITNNRIFDFFVATGASAGGTGIYVGNYNNNVLISGNSIYQSANRTATVNLNYRCISINSPSGSGFNILNNFLGGSAAGATGTVPIISATGNRWVNAKMIDITETSFTAPSLISGNTIRGIATSSTASASVVTEGHLIGISVNRGSVNVRNNTIGGTIANSSLTGTFNATSAACSGLVGGIVFRTDATGTGILGDIEGNSIDNMQLNVSGATASASSVLTGIYAVRNTGGNTIAIKRNIVGHVSGAPTFTIGSVATPPGNVVLYALAHSGNTGPAIIEKNKIGNVSNGVTTATTLTYGLLVNTPANLQVNGNEVFNVTASSSSSANTTGIYIANVGASPSSTQRNTVYGINTGSGSGSNGIMVYVNSAANVPLVANNMVTMNGASTNNSYKGLYIWGTAGSVNVFANSVAIIGAATGAEGTACIFRYFTAGFGPAITLRANIFLNTRSGGTGAHNALVSSGVDFTGITSNYNLLFSSVPNSLTSMNGVFRNYTDWQTASGQDANSRNFNISPKFMNTALGNLRIPDDNSADVLNNIVDKGAATAGANPVTDDVDNTNRQSIVDIGASEVSVMWLGTTSNAWALNTNWSGNTVPTCAGRNLIKIGPNVPGIVLNQPTISAGAANFLDMTILEGATVTITGASGSLVQCSTTDPANSLKNEGTLAVTGARPISLYGDFVQNNIFTTGTGTVTLLGGAIGQSIDGEANPVTFYNLSTTGGGSVTTKQTVLVNNSLALTSGTITTSTTYPLVLAAAASYTGGSDASHINGPMGKQTNSTTPFVFPIGKGGILRTASITPSNALASTFYAEYFNQSAVDNIGSAMGPTVSTVSDKEYWRFNRTGSANGFITLTWNANSFVSADQADRDLLGVVRWNGSQWINHYQTSNTGTQASGSVVSQFVGVFDTYFTLGSSTTNNPLPIELLYFRAALAEGMVRAEWATEMEESFDRFELEKASSDLVFTKIGEVKSLATGEPWKLRTYSHIDETPYIGDNYYRLKAIDLDGTFQYYNVVRVFNPGEGTLNVYPNPIRSTEVLTVKVDFTPTPQDKVILMNLQGTEVQHTAITGGGVNEITLGNNVKPGLYLLRYTSPAFQKTFKVVVR